MDLSFVKKACSSAKASTAGLSVLSAKKKNAALIAMAHALSKKYAYALKENAKDIKLAEKKGLPASMVGRLALNKKKIDAIVESLASISRLPDPVGRVLSEVTRPNGLVIRKVSVPIGVILIIYESRPNVTADCMALCLKSGNSVILKGGSEALNSNRALFNVLSGAAYRNGVPRGAFEFVATSDRAVVKRLLQMDQWIDLVIPRGGEGLIRDVASLSKIPVIKHYKGVCHVYIDKRANFKKSLDITLNAKVQNPGVCNAMETLLVHRDVAKNYLPRIGEELKKRGVELRGDAAARALVPGIGKAVERDWSTEYLDLVLSVRVVKDLNQAIWHVQNYGSHHSDAIVTEDSRAAKAFVDRVDSACVFVNASTRFNDGGEFGMGAEMGISTDKLHARGPMGLEELTSYKYVVLGDGQVRG
jgi:glutamate-5-semialdehyde dehydrogenase